ncbi:hypothetical protein MKD49_12225 [Herbaspirillum sp. WGmk3]|nr:hypothetical protein [Herbaspirillum sp. WGmk3]MCO4857246.1 hypothetical protein [Herbaspirillum sp. WGmk3]
MNDQFENALAWFSSAPGRWISSARKDLSAAGEWLWGVIQGDFNENPTTAQTAVSTVVSMIPFVDQICDVRDIVANCKKIHSEPNEVWHWVALCLTLIGLFPTLGSLVKGCGKVMFSALRRASLGAARKATAVLPDMTKYIELSISLLNRFLARPEVVKTLRALKIDNPYKYLAVKLREVKAQVNVGKLLAAFDDGKKATLSLLELVRKWGGAALGDRAIGLMKLVNEVRAQADRMLAKALKPLQDLLDQLARRLDIESDMLHRARLNTVNPHGFRRTTTDAEKDAFDKDLPSWATKSKTLKYPPLEKAPPIPPGYPRFDDGLATKNAYDTFNTIRPLDLPPGTKLRRVLDPKSADNSICWMTEEEFQKLQSKADWRKRFAVWASWNSNGEVITYIVPEGGLKVWEGVVASQKLKNSSYVLEGGARQIVVNPDDLKKALVSKRQPTHWGYDEFGQKTDLVGVPVLTNNWYESKKK